MTAPTRSPIIVFGMHRSGTTMVTRLLGALGVFFGVDIDSNGESFFFLRRNEWLMRRAGAAWDQPLGVRHLLENPHLRAKAVSLLRRHTDSWRFAEYMGLKAYLRRAKTLNRRPWGWKDPRMTFLLPLWLELYPGAKLVYVQRNGVDVALSLHRRQLGLQSSGADTSLLVPSLARRIWHALDPIEWYPMQSPRNHDLRESFALWVEYTDAAEDLLRTLPGRVHRVTYEEMLSAPDSHLRSLAAFCELSTPQAALSHACGQIRGDRAYSFMTKSDERAFYEEVSTHPTMKRLGYDRINQKRGNEPHPGGASLA